MVSTCSVTNPGSDDRKATAFAISSGRRVRPTIVPLAHIANSRLELLFAAPIPRHLGHDPAGRHCVYRSRPGGPAPSPGGASESAPRPWSRHSMSSLAAQRRCRIGGDVDDAAIASPLHSRRHAAAVFGLAVPSHCGSWRRAWRHRSPSRSRSFSLTASLG